MSDLFYFILFFTLLGGRHDLGRCPGPVMEALPPETTLPLAHVR